MYKPMEIILQKFIKYIVCMSGGLLLAFETTLLFFVPCLLAIILDIISAWFLGRRVHRQCPQCCDGKFKSEYKFRILYTMIVVFLAIILADYVDRLVIKDTDITVRFVVGVFLFYETYSCLENWSSENNKPWARALQRIMVNKAERHLNVPLKDILLDKENKGNTPDKPQS